ncbi:MAG: endonuclease/exonuclease/phosphatase family protein [Muribaculaceae bacterium]|nr:endonuclease/exonuclease/phosphatase family protein [Muribaculaceae bacterium]
MNKTVKKTGFWRGLLRTILVILTLIASIGTLIGAYGGDYSPTVFRGICLMVMVFPFWVLALIIVTILDALWCRKALLISLLAFIPSAPAIWNICPLNIFGPSEKAYKDCPKFTLMSYNVLNFLPVDSVFPDSLNPTLSFILKADPDIACLQEAHAFIPANNNILIPKVQVDSILERYPYVLLYGKTQTLLSKYPAEVIPIGYNSRRKGNEIAVFRVTVDGVPITIFNVHLQSYNLRSDDKYLYQELTELKKVDRTVKESIFDIKSQLIAKIQKAAEGRELDAERLIGYLSRLGGPNVIVTGDFNDVPGCYTLRRLADCDLHEVYPEVGFGPLITYHADRFYFRIDHTLYRGCLKPLKMKRPTPPFSDHYPLITTFAVTGDNK